MIRVQVWNEFVSPKFYGPLAIWPWLWISPHSSLNVIYCLIITAWQCLMSFIYTLYFYANKPNKSPLRNRFLALFLWEFSHPSSPSRSCLGRLVLSHNTEEKAGQYPHQHINCFKILYCSFRAGWISALSVKDKCVTAKRMKNRKL